jgi:hypothetical protein
MILRRRSPTFSRCRNERVHNPERPARPPGWAGAAYSFLEARHVGRHPTGARRGRNDAVDFRRQAGKRRLGLGGLLLRVMAVSPFAHAPVVATVSPALLALLPYLCFPVRRKRLRVMLRKSTGFLALAVTTSFYGLRLMDLDRTTTCVCVCVCVCVCIYLPTYLPIDRAPPLPAPNRCQFIYRSSDNISCHCCCVVSRACVQAPRLTDRPLVPPVSLFPLCPLLLSFSFSETFWRRRSPADEPRLRSIFLPIFPTFFFFPLATATRRVLRGL